MQRKVSFLTAEGSEDSSEPTHPRMKKLSLYECSVQRMYWIRNFDRCPVDPAILESPESAYAPHVEVIESTLELRPNVPVFFVPDRQVDFTVLKMEILECRSGFPGIISIDKSMATGNGRGHGRTEFGITVNSFCDPMHPIALVDSLRYVRNICTLYDINPQSITRGVYEHEGVVWMSSSHILLASAKKRYRDGAFESSPYVAMDEEMYEKILSEFDLSNITMRYPHSNFLDSSIRVVPVAFDPETSNPVCTVTVRLSLFMHDANSHPKILDCFEKTASY